MTQNKLLKNKGILRYGQARYLRYQGSSSLYQRSLLQGTELMTCSSATTMPASLSTQHSFPTCQARGSDLPPTAAEAGCAGPHPPRHQAPEQGYPKSARKVHQAPFPQMTAQPCAPSARK
eukprot:scaffold157612_cov15-Tisochrysis_lutea.AAC.1